MGDVIPFTAQRTVEFGLAGTGFYLVNAAYNQLAEEGIRVTRAALERFVRSGAQSLETVVNHFRRQAQRPGTVSSIERKMGTQTTGAKRPRGNDNNVPKRIDITPSAILGQVRDFTTSKSSCKVSGGKKNSKKMRREVLDDWATARWQSISKEPAQKLSLGMELMKWTTAAVPQNHLALPMYAFNCNDLPFNDREQVETKSFHRLESVPMYRLYKHYSTGSLEQVRQNYYWEMQNGYQNGPSADFANTSDPTWHPLNMDCRTINTINYKPNYTVFDILIQCPRTMSCKMHFSVVNMINGVAPPRYYCDGQVWSGSSNPAVVSRDPTEPDDWSMTDTFWETFWDKKIGHPLSQYNNPTRKPYIKFIKDDVLTITPENNTVPNAVHFRHRKEIVVKNGTWYDTNDDAGEDQQLARGNAASYNFGQLPPVTTLDRYTYGYGYNVTLPTKDVPGLFDISENARDRNAWLLIWMEDLSISNSAAIRELTTDTEKTNFNRPESVQPSDHSCSFDIKVTRHFSIDKVGV